MAEHDQGNLDKIKITEASRPPSINRDDREFRIKQIKDRQNEERQRKLDEIKSQALAAQKFKEQKEQERRLRMEEMKIKDVFKRQQVEERKKAINDAERDRLESILRRNQEREARMESKKRNERSSNVFAFGSSTPRMLEPVDSIGSFWGHRRATSTQNIMCSVPFTRRQSERESDGGCKKRATSAGGLECSAEDVRMSTSMYEIFDRGNTNNSNPAQTSSASNIFGTPTIAAGCASGYLGRRRTDLMPTIPSRERDSFSATPRKSFARSPGRAYSMTRLDQLAKPRRKSSDLPPLSESPGPLSKSQQSSVSRSMSHLAFSKQATNQQQKNLRKSDSMQQLPLILPRPTRAMQLRQQKLNTTVTSTQSEASSRPSSSLSHQSTSSVTSSVNMRTRPITAPRRPRPASIAVTGISVEKNGISDPKKQTKPPLPKPRHSTVRKSQEKLESSVKKTEQIIRKRKILASPTTDAVQHLPLMHSPVENKTVAAGVENVEKNVSTKPVDSNVVENIIDDTANENKIVITETVETNKIEDASQKLIDSERENGAMIVAASSVNTNGLKEQSPPVEPFKDTSINDQNKENTDHYNKVINNKDSSAIESGNTEMNVKEVNNMNIDVNLENVNNLEENAMTKSRITTEEEAKAALAERRRLAREEAERLAEMERLKIEEEARLELEKQQREEETQRLLIEQQRAAEQQRLQEAIREAEKKEEEEKQKREEEQRLKLLKEEAERKAREEAEKQKIELQERLKNEEKEREARRKRVEAIMLRTRGKNSSSTQQIDEKDETTKINGSKLNSSELNSDDNNSTEITHKNGKDVETVDNLIPVDSIKNANTVNIDSLSTDDTLNSNNAWQHNTQTDLLM